MADFTPTQGRYLSYIHAYTKRFGYPPAEAEIAKAMCVSPPSVSQMVKTLERKGLLLRYPGQARALQVLVPDEEILPWCDRKLAAESAGSSARSGGLTWAPAAPPANLYVLSVYLTSGPISEKFAKKYRVISRVIEIRGNQTLEDLHYAILKAYDRWDEHLYEFQLGERPFDPKGPSYGISGSPRKKEEKGDARTTKMDDLKLKPERVFGYWFDFGDDWYHQIQVERIEQAIPTATYPRVIRRVGKSPHNILTSNAASGMHHVVPEEKR